MEHQRVNPARISCLQAGPTKNTVCYWMRRDQRLKDNWALIHAQDLALTARQALRIVFCLDQNRSQQKTRQYNFMLQGIKELTAQAKEFGISFDVLFSNDKNKLYNYIKKYNIGTLVTDFSPLKQSRLQQNNIINSINIPFYIVDTHNIVPVWLTSNKQEYAARTIRPKIQKYLNEFLEPFPTLVPHPYRPSAYKEPDWTQAGNNQNKKSSFFIPGYEQANQILQQFMQKKMKYYATNRNNPTLNFISKLSPYLHFGQISAQKVAWKVAADCNGCQQGREAFLEELIIRKELAENFCFYNQNYDNLEGGPAWGLKTLEKHRQDMREYSYSLEEFEHSQTHDPLWNTAQKEMILTGKMHGYMRMYWAKKILEWTPDPQTAITYAISLNDNFELDGHDPCGYTGIMWSMTGLHDRPWKERPIFGTIRYMSYEGCKRKFDVQQYIKQISRIAG